MIRGIRMSEALPIDQLREESVRFGSNPYLLTQGDDGRPHAVAVSIEWQGDRILTSTGTRSAPNVASCPYWSACCGRRSGPGATASMYYFNLSPCSSAGDHAGILNRIFGNESIIHTLKFW